MTGVHTASTALLVAANSTSSKPSSGSFYSFLFLIVIFALAYFVFLRPRAQAARRQRDTLMELSVGDEVLTGAGIFGTVLDVEADRVTLETAPGTRITVLRSTIARRFTEHTVADEGWDEHDEHEAHEAHEAYELERHGENEHDADEHDVEDHDDEHESHDEHDEHEDEVGGEEPDAGTEEATGEGGRKR